MDFMVDEVLPRRISSPSVRPLASPEKLPYRLDPDLTLDSLPQLCWSFGLRAGQVLPEPPPYSASDLMSLMKRGGGSGGGAPWSSSRAFGIDIGIEEDKPPTEDRAVLVPDRLGIIIRLEAFEL